jgi:hypothetical protein
VVAKAARRWIAARSKLPDHAAAELAAEPDVFATDKFYAATMDLDGVTSACSISPGFSSPSRGCGGKTRWMRLC